LEILSAEDHPPRAEDETRQHRYYERTNTLSNLGSVLGKWANNCPNT